jgi:hypothetical protein
MGCKLRSSGSENSAGTHSWAWIDYPLPDKTIVVAAAASV